MHSSRSRRAALRPGPAVLLVALAAAAALSGCGANPAETAVHAQALPGGARPVGVVVPKQGDVTRAITQPATIQGLEEASLYAKASGYLKTIAVDKGDRVRQGQVLAVIESPELHDQQRQADSAYRQSLAATQGAIAAKGRAEADVQQG